MLSYFDRRKQRLDKLAATIKGADDQTLASVLASASTKELAAVLGLVPVDRANRLVIDVPKDRLDAALAASLDGATHSERTAGRTFEGAFGPPPWALYWALYWRKAAEWLGGLGQLA